MKEQQRVSSGAPPTGSLVGNAIRRSLDNVIGWLVWFASAALSLYFGSVLLRSGHPTAQLLATAGIFAVAVMTEPLDFWLLAMSVNRFGRLAAVTKKLALATVVSIVAAVTVAASAAAAPSGPGSAQDTINELQAFGYRVIVNRFGDAPLDRCTVTAIRPGRQITQPRTGSGGDLVQEVLYTTVYVDAKC